MINIRHLTENSLHLALKEKAPHMKQNYPSNYLKKITGLKVIFLIMVLSFSGQKAFSNPIDGTIFTYDKCTGYIKITYNYDNIGCGTCDDDYIISGNLQYKNTSGGWVSFHTWNNGLSYFNGVVGGGYAIRTDVHSRDITLYDRPSDMKYPYEFKFDYSWANHQGQTDATDNGTHLSGPIFNPIIERPNNIVASTDICGQVNLSWDNPFQTWEISSSCTGLSYENQIFRDNNYLTTVASNVNTYTDYSVASNTTYSYKVVQIYKPNGYSSANVSSMFSTASTGGPKPSPPAPNNFVASDDRCDGTIDLSWDYNYSNPQDFVIILLHPETTVTMSQEILKQTVFHRATLLWLLP